MTWKTCKVHGDDKPGVWGCPECLRELREENAALRNSLKAANANAERFEREWYLRGDVLEEAIAWAELERVRELPEGWIGKARALMTPNTN